MNKIKVLVVDDSVFMRTTLSKIISCDKIEVVGTAANGKQAIEQIRLLKPDFVTMDIEMPVMSGLEALKIIMEENPLPVLMVSAFTSEGAAATLEALSLGALDFFTKKAAFGEMFSMKEELIEKIIDISRNFRLKPSQSPSSNVFAPARKDESQANSKWSEGKADSMKNSDMAKILAEKSRVKKEEIKLANETKRAKNKDIEAVVIGVSTGGPVALLELFKALPANIPVPILIVQHMPPIFTKSLADRLNSYSKLNVKEAQDGDRLAPGTAYLAPGGLQMTVTKRGTISISNEPKDELFKPSVNVLMNSAIAAFGNKILGVMMTGMGHDGRDAFLKLHQKGGYIIVQDPLTCVVAGMVRSVVELNIADETHPLNKLAEAIETIVMKS